MKNFGSPQQAESGIPKFLKKLYGILEVKYFLIDKNDNFFLL